MDVCVMPQQLNLDFDIVSVILIQHYNKNIETQLNSDEQQLLNEISDKLNEIATAQNINFNKDGFNTFVKKLYVCNFTQFGGIDELVPHSTEKSCRPNKLDFFAIIAFVGAIFILYISFVKFNELSQSIIGMSIDEVGEDAKSQVQDALSKIRELPTEEVTFLQYVWSSIQTFSCSIIETQTQRLRNIVIESLSHTVQDFTEIATRTCIPKTQVIPEGSYAISSSFTGNIDLGITFNSLVQGVTGVLSKDVITQCVSSTALLLQKRAIDELFHQQGLMLNQLTTQSTQALTFLTYGAQMGTVSVMYLVYRIKDILGTAYEQIKENITKENITEENITKKPRNKGNFRVRINKEKEEKGGNRKKYTKKNRKISKKNRKTSIKL